MLVEPVAEGLFFKTFAAFSARAAALRKAWRGRRLGLPSPKVNAEKKPPSTAPDAAAKEARESPTNHAAGRARRENAHACGK